MLRYPVLHFTRSVIRWLHRVCTPLYCASRVAVQCTRPFRVVHFIPCGRELRSVCCVNYSTEFWLQFTDGESLDPTAAAYTARFSIAIVHMHPCCSCTLPTFPNIPHSSMPPSHGPLFVLYHCTFTPLCCIHAHLSKSRQRPRRRKKRGNTASPQQQEPSRPRPPAKRSPWRRALWRSAEAGARLKLTPSPKRTRGFRGPAVAAGTRSTSKPGLCKCRSKWNVGMCVCVCSCFLFPFSFCLYLFLLILCLFCFVVLFVLASFFFFSLSRWIFRDSCQIFFFFFSLIIFTDSVIPHFYFKSLFFFFFCDFFFFVRWSVWRVIFLGTREKEGKHPRLERSQCFISLLSLSLSRSAHRGCRLYKSEPISWLFRRGDTSQVKWRSILAESFGSFEQGDHRKGRGVNERHSAKRPKKSSKLAPVQWCALTYPQRWALNDSEWLYCWRGKHLLSSHSSKIEKKKKKTAQIVRSPSP